MMKRILGLDLGTSSIGWAYVLEAQDDNEISKIEKLGVRVNPLTTDEQLNFEKGKPITTNAGRTLARSARRNLQRFKLRRDNLIEVLKREKWIDDKSILTENGNKSTFETYALRATAASKEIGLEELARVLLMINKKRGYKSSRKVNKEDEGQLVDGIEVAKKLYHENLPPGAFVYQLLKEGKKKLPDFYRSDLQRELDLIWDFQANYYPDLLTPDFKEELKGKGLRATSAIIWSKYKFNTAENKGTREEKKIQAYQWRKDGLTKQLEKEEVAYIIAEINGQLTNSSGYLGAISDRSKELYFNKQTVGQYLFNQLQQNTHARLKNQVFYRQDYLDEFEKIWSVQSQFHHCLTEQLKEEIRDIIIFYQRKLKSQKGLISFCEFEQREVVVNGKNKVIGLRVAPKSSPMFQEFKIWQQLNNVKLRNKTNKEVYNLAEEQKKYLFETLNLKGKLSAHQVLSLIEGKPKEWELNYTELEGNSTNAALYNAYLDILDMEGYDVRNELKIKLNKDEITLSDLDKPVSEIKDMIRRIFQHLGINTFILDFDAQLQGDDFEKQLSYQLWHLLYSYEEDDSKTGMDRLYNQLNLKFGFSLDQAKIIGKIALQDDYGNLSTKAMRQIYPYIQDAEYSAACKLAGYNHSKSSLTKEQLTNRVLKDHLDILPKNSLRNPVVEKILNQMVNVVNTLIDTENDKLVQEGKEADFRFDEIRIELARELKKNAKEREELTKAINTSKAEHEKIINILQTEDGIKNPTRNDIIRFKLYQELKNNGYKNLYTNEYIQRKDLFTNVYDIDHIIPQSRLFDDSFSNKVLVPRNVNIEKGNQTAFDYIHTKFGEDGIEAYEARVERLFNLREEGVSRSKYRKLLMRGSDIGEGFIERDLRDSQYIAKKAKAMLFEITPSVISTSGSVTDRLREDWGLVSVMKELNLPKFKAVGLTEYLETKDGNRKEVIKDWSKRNDHRHHAMDAITVAFTKHSHIQYLNHLNARKNEKSEFFSTIKAIEMKETYVDRDDLGNRKRFFKEPIAHFRSIVKAHLERILVSHKAKNKVVTKNRNKIDGKKEAQEVLTPRGQLHKETIYGKILQYTSKEEKISAKFDAATIAMVSNPRYRSALLDRLTAYGNDPKKAFTGKNSPIKSPIYFDQQRQLAVPEKVKLVWLEEDYTIRKAIGPDLKIEKVIDRGVKRVLEQRLSAYGGDTKKAFSDLENNPIWLNEEKGIAIKRVTISGVKNAEALHTKKDHFGQVLKDKDGNTMPVDFVSTGNNHHVAIYADENGALQERIVSFYEAVARVNSGFSIIDKDYNQHLGWKFLFSMKQNEMFLFPSEDFDPKQINFFDRNSYKLISENLFRVQKFTIKDYFFRHHLETNVEDNSKTKGKLWRREGLNGINGIVKVRINHLGEIVQVGEY